MIIGLGDDIAAVFRQRMRDARIENGLSQDELANMVGSTKQVISTYELGVRIPKVPMAVSISNALGKPLDWMFGTEDFTNERPTPVTESEPSTELSNLIGQLTQEQQRWLISQVKGILSNRE